MVIGLLLVLSLSQPATQRELRKPSCLDECAALNDSCADMLMNSMKKSRAACEKICAKLRELCPKECERRAKGKDKKP
jgi:hypothetical protein